ncbi:MAG TPA: ATP synthase F0 subunit B [Terriglobia bacterium]|nr:ATP synthase F0 subunit B [Terriglobia bacterium]
MRRARSRFLLIFMLAASAVAGSRLASAQPPRLDLGSAALLLQANPTESRAHENLFDLINLIILVGVLVYLLRKPVGQFFSQRSEDIRKGLEEGRRALAAAQEQLSAAEEKLHRLEQEIGALKESARKEMAAERERTHRAAEAETGRILASARSMIHSATQAAKVELKLFAVRQATDLAEKMIRERLNEQDQSRLVNRFLQGIPRGPDGKQSVD